MKIRNSPSIYEYIRQIAQSPSSFRPNIQVLIFYGANDTICYIINYLNILKIWYEFFWLKWENKFNRISRRITWERKGKTTIVPNVLTAADRATWSSCATHPHNVVIRKILTRSCVGISKFTSEERIILINKIQY